MNACARRLGPSSRNHLQVQGLLGRRRRR
jgi:hypothetical protein